MPHSNHLCWGAALPWHPQPGAEGAGEPQTYLPLASSLCFSSGTQFLNQDWAFPNQWKLPAVLFHSASRFSQAICLDFGMRTIWLDPGWHQAGWLNQCSLKNGSAQKAVSWTIHNSGFFCTPKLHQLLYRSKVTSKAWCTTTPWDKFCPVTATWIWSNWT